MLKRFGVFGWKKIAFMKKITLFFKRFLLCLVIFVFVIVIFRGSFYRSFINYKSIRERQINVLPNKEFLAFVEEKIANKTPSSIKEIIQLSLQITSSHLRFYTTNTTVNPNILLQKPLTNCIGYSAFFNATCNYLLKKYGYSSYKSNHLIGKMYLGTTNIHSYFSSPFFKDHDFNSITNYQSGEVFYVDPTINDYVLIDFISCKN